MRLDIWATSSVLNANHAECCMTRLICSETETPSGMHTITAMDRGLRSGSAHLSVAVEYAPSAEPSRLMSVHEEMTMLHSALYSRRSISPKRCQAFPDPGP